MPTSFRLRSRIRSAQALPHPSKSSSIATAAPDIQQRILGRFPVLWLLKFADRREGRFGNLPRFVGLIAATLESARKPCCFILPDEAGVALAVSTLLAVNRLRAEFPELLRAHAAVNFREGIDHVLVHPAGLVYRYEGFFTPEFFRLGVVDRRDCRSLPVRDIARLEKTNRKRPKGTLASDLGRSEPSVLGALLGIESTLNRNVLRNRVLMLGSRKAILEQLDRWSIQITEGNRHIRRALVEEIPFGKVVDGGNLTLLDGYVAEGEPLVAIASRAADLAAYCERASRFSKAVVVSDIELLVRDFRAYDGIVENQRAAIISTDSSRESVRLLAERGCEIWRLSPDEILLGQGDVPNPDGPLNQLLTKASRVTNLVVSEVPCTEDHLDKAADALRQAAEAVASADNGTIRELFYSLFRLLMVCAEYVGQAPAEFRQATTKLMQSAREQLGAAEVWLSAETYARVDSALENMQVAVIDLTEGSATTPKGAALIEALKSGSADGNQNAVIVARSKREDLQDWMVRSGVQARVYSIDNIPESEVFGRVLVLSWPRSSRFDDLVHQYFTGDLRLVAYPFEQRWLKQYRRAYKRSTISEISPKRKFEMIGLAAAGISDVDTDSAESVEAVAFDIPEERFLGRRKRAARGGNVEEEQETIIEASYVDFVGPTFAYLTEGHEVAVVNGYVSGQMAGGTKVPMRSVDELKIGDYVLFRESGDSDIIRFIAEDEVGKEAYGRLRAEATRWRKPLNSLGRDPHEVWERLRSIGFSRHLTTVKSWLFDESRICPRDIGDVRKIAEASGDQELFESLPQLEKAKEDLMSLHISAGFRLTQLLMKELPGKIGSLFGGETELDLGVGKVWIVRIQEIDRTPSPQRRSHVNRLLWDVQEAE